MILKKEEVAKLTNKTGGLDGHAQPCSRPADYSGRECGRASDTIISNVTLNAIQTFAELGSKCMQDVLR